MSVAPQERIIVDLEFVSDPNLVMRLVQELAGHVAMFRVGLVNVAQSGLQLARSVQSLGGSVLFDTALAGDYHQVGAASKAVSMGLAPRMCTVSAVNAAQSLRLAADNKGKSLVLANATILDTCSAAECVSLLGSNPEKRMLQFAQQAERSGIDGIICPAWMVGSLRRKFGTLVFVASGTTASSAPKAGSMMSAAEAVRAGADYVITDVATRAANSIDPLGAIRRLVDDIAGAAT